MERRELILQISKELGLSHIGSNLAELPVLEEIHATKQPGDIVVLDNSHSHLSHLIMEDPLTAKEKIKHDIHCNKEAGCVVAGGSLGIPLAIGAGIALANRDRDVYITVSDGGCSEGIFFEVLQIAKEQNLTNLKIYMVMNGWGAFREIDLDQLEQQIKGFGFPVEFRRVNSDFEGGLGQSAHYSKYEG